MMETMNCIYETPCGWCTKWDKKCDCKIGEQPRYQNEQEQTSCNHEWEVTNSGGAYTDFDGKSKAYIVYRCKLCNETKNVY